MGEVLGGADGYALLLEGGRRGMGRQFEWCWKLTTSVRLDLANTIRGKALFVPPNLRGGMKKKSQGYRIMRTAAR